MASPAPAVGAVRRFNRFYTRQLGFLREAQLASPFSLAECRVLYELAHRADPTPTELGRELGLDPGYLSRILRGFRRRGLVDRRPSPLDGRQTHLRLTRHGRDAFARLDARSSDEVAELLKPLSPSDRGRLSESMDAIERLLGADRSAHPRAARPIVLRGPQPGDLGWIVYRHGVLYQREYGYNEDFEALVAQIVAEFVQNLDPRRERCWVAETDAGIAGCVFLVRKSAAVAKLRLLLVEPTARGLGLGGRLVAECVKFARQAGYKKITLWTQSELLPARRLYERAGFTLVAKKPHRSFGKDLVAETWDLKL